ncbi:MAG: hypothetical protein ACR2I2_11880 [Bryobacteraceae bacterium]
MIKTCESIRQLVVDHLASQTEVQEVHGACVVTLPLLTVDKRWIDVFVEPRVADFFLVNDGGKAVNELILQGMKITPSIENHFEIFAATFGVAYTDEVFQTGAKMAGLAKAITAVGMCSTLAMTEILKHIPSAVDESLNAQLASILKRWSPRRAKITERVKVSGELKQHEFDFLVSPKRRQPVSISILNPTAGALSAAERFGFKIQDLSSTPVGKWRKVAVEAKAEVWRSDARRIVEKCADIVIPISSGDHAGYEQFSEVLDDMVA